MTSSSKTRWATQLLTAAFLSAACADEGNSTPDASDGGAVGKGDDPNGDGDAAAVDLSRLTAIDTAFLLPSSFGPGASPLLPVSSGGARGPLLPNEDYFAVLHETGDLNAQSGEGIPQDTYASLYVTGFRYDPCAPSTYHGAFGNQRAIKTCPEVIRLVAQPWNAEEGRFATAGLHLFYPLDPATAKLARANLVKVAEACPATKEKNGTQLPIGPHPCLAGSGGKKFFEETIKPLLFDALIGQANLGGAAQFATVVNDGAPFFRWRFAFVTPTAITDELGTRPGMRQVGPLPNLQLSDAGSLRVDTVAQPDISLEEVYPKGVPIAELHGDVQRGADGKIRAPTTAIGILAQRVGTWIRQEEDGGPSAFDQLAAELKADPTGDVFQGIIAAYLAENHRLSPQPELPEFFARGPAKFADFFEGPECATCHLQTPILAYLESIDLLAALQGANLDETVQKIVFQKIDELGTPKDGHHEEARQAYTDSVVGSAIGDTDRPLRVMNFAFDGRIPSVNRRTANEAVDVVTYLREGRLNEKTVALGGACNVSAQCGEGQVCRMEGDDAGTCQPAPEGCLRMCDTGKACGDACIAKNETCSIDEPGTACNVNPESGLPCAPLCTTGVACGNSCIDAGETCSAQPGTACDVNPESKLPCTRMCGAGKACGNSCIGQGDQCSQPAGSACDAR